VRREKCGGVHKLRLAQRRAEFFSGGGVAGVGGAARFRLATVAEFGG